MKNELFDAIARCTTELPFGEVVFRANSYVPNTFGVRLSWKTDNRRGVVLRNIPAENRESVAQTLERMLEMANAKISELKGTI